MMTRVSMVLGADLVVGAAAAASSFHTACATHRTSISVFDHNWLTGSDAE